MQALFAIFFARLHSATKKLPNLTRRSGSHKPTTKSDELAMRHACTYSPSSPPTSSHRPPKTPVPTALHPGQYSISQTDQHRSTANHLVVIERRALILELPTPGIPSVPPPGVAKSIFHSWPATNSRTPMTLSAISPHRSATTPKVHSVRLSNASWAALHGNTAEAGIQSAPSATQ